MPRRATKPKSAKKAAPKTRRKSKPSQHTTRTTAEETKQSEITQTMPVVVEAAPEAAEPAAETLVAAAAPEPVMETAPVTPAMETPLTEEPHAGLAEPKFELYKDKSDKFRFRLKARNGEIIATGEAYNSKEGCLNGIESMKRNSPAAAIVEVEPEEPKPEVHPEELPAAQPEAAQEQAPVTEPVAAAAEIVVVPPATQPLATVPPEPSPGEAEEEEPGESSLAEELPPRRDVPPNHMFIGKKPVMGYALSAAMQLTQYEEVVLRARGKAISRAVDVAEVIRHRLGNGRFVTRYIRIDTDVVGEGAEKRNVSTIEIGVGKRT